MGNARHFIGQMGPLGAVNNVVKSRDVLTVAPV